MELAVEKIGDVALVVVNLEQLDASNSDDFRRDMTPIMDDCRKVVLDLGPVSFVDSSGCGVILSCLKHLTAEGGDLKICRVAPSVLLVFEMIRLHRLCEIVGTPEAAVKAFQTVR